MAGRKRKKVECLTPAQKLSRNNKNRGSSFERKVARVLGWTRVPYSGGNKAYGAGDVVDGYHTRNGRWLAECKTQPAGTVRSVSISSKWIGQTEKAVKASPGRHGVIITRITEVGNDEAWVLMPPEAFWPLYQVEDALIDEDVHTIFTVRGLRAFTLKRDLLDSITGCKTVQVVSVDSEDLERVDEWYVMRLDLFAAVLQEHKLYVPETKT